jgi:hypothetical protein
MKIGMLWYDKLPLPDKVRAAARHYAQKYGHAPNLCFVRCANGQVSVDGIEIREMASVLPGHIWIGVKDE